MKKTALSTSSSGLRNIIRPSLGFLLGFSALNAFGGGYYGIVGSRRGARGMACGKSFQNLFYPRLNSFCHSGWLLPDCSNTGVCPFPFFPPCFIHIRHGCFWLACRAVGHYWICLLDAACDGFHGADHFDTCLVSA